MLRKAIVKRIILHRQQGGTLVEVLVALLLCAFGILGVVGLQASMTRAQTASTFRAEAAFLAQELIGTMWSDRPNLAGYDTSACSAACKDWMSRLAARLPAGDATVGIDAGTGTVTIEIRWTPSGGATNRFATATVVTSS
jgi:type IV pilus assembly protein PilV